MNSLDGSIIHLQFGYKIGVTEIRDNDRHVCFQADNMNISFENALSIALRFLFSDIFKCLLITITNIAKCENSFGIHL